MRSFVPLAAAVLLSTASAAPGWADWINPGKCLNPRSAQYLVDGFGSLLSNYNAATADKILADDLVDWSDSINELAGIPLGVPTFPSKAAFEAGQGSQSPIPFNLMAIDAVTCDTIALRWNTTLPPNTVKGITILKAENSQGQPDTWQIKTIFTEFNSIAWLEDIGGNCSAPQH